MRNADLDDLKDEQYAERIRQERKGVDAMPKTQTTNPLSDKSIVYCMERNNFGDQSAEHYVRIPCKTKEDAFFVQTFLTKVRGAK